MPSEHREALQRVRTDSAQALQLHRQILDRQREINRRQLDIAKLVLAAERSRVQRAGTQYRRDLESAKAEAQEYKVVWLQAKKDGARLLQFVDRHFKKAA